MTIAEPTTRPKPLAPDAVAIALCELPDIGESRANALVAAYGGRALDALADGDVDLGEIVRRSGIPLHAARAAREELPVLLERLHAMATLRTALPTIPTRAVNKLLDAYGGNAIDAIREDPYGTICDLPGCSFLTADSVAQALGYANNDPRRLAAGVTFTMQAAEGEGHTCLPPAALFDQASQLLLVSRDAVAEAAEAHPDVVLDAGTARYYRRATLAREDELAQRLCDIDLAAAPRVGITIDHTSLADDQAAAIEAICRGSGIAILTGGPGTGKTYLTKRIIETFTDDGLSVVLAAPTGKAARVLADKAGRSASTIHSLLGPDVEHYKRTGKWRFCHNHEAPLPADVIIIDEASMLDLYLALSLVRAVKPGARVIFVGDTDQLPPVGAGNVFRDMIAAHEAWSGPSASFVVARLTTIKRQASESSIPYACRAIRDGQLPPKPSDLRSSGAATDFIWKGIGGAGEDGQLAIIEEAKRLVATVIPAKHPELDPVWDIQIITAHSSQKGKLCVPRLNVAFQELLNPTGTPTAVQFKVTEDVGDGADARDAATNTYAFRVGDKVIRLRNDNKLGVVNGDIFRVLEPLRRGEKLLRVARVTDGRTFELPENQHQCQLAYALTTHKAQGSEAPVVLVLIHPYQRRITNREWLYTAVSRAQRLCFVIGGAIAVSEAIAQRGGAVRWTGLVPRIEDKGVPF